MKSAINVMRRCLKIRHQNNVIIIIKSRLLYLKQTSHKTKIKTIIKTTINTIIKSIKKALKTNINDFINFNERVLNNIIYF